MLIETVFVNDFEIVNSIARETGDIYESDHGSLLAIAKNFIAKVQFENRPTGGTDKK